MSDVIQAYVVRSDGKAETHTRLVVLATNHQRKYNALAAENARLREAVAEIERMLLEDCTTWSQIQDALHMALAPAVQPPEERT